MKITKICLSVHDGWREVMSKLLWIWRKVSNNHFFKFGLPFITFMIIVPFGLKDIQSIRISERDRQTHFLSRDEEYKFEKQKVVKFDIEQELKKTKDKLNIDQWENKRIPRSWEK